MRFIGAFILLLSTNLVFAQTDSPESYFDFWVGKWELTWVDANGNEGAGTNVIEKTLDGIVIQENFRALSGAYAGMKGTSLSVYNPQTQKIGRAHV